MFEADDEEDHAARCQQHSRRERPDHLAHTDREVECADADRHISQVVQRDGKSASQSEGFGEPEPAPAIGADVDRATRREDQKPRRRQNNGR